MKTSSHKYHYMPGDRLPDECRVAAFEVIDNRTLRMHRGEVRSHVERNMRERLAFHLIHNRLQTKEGEFETEFRMDLLVFHPDEFWAVVETEVQRQLSLARNYAVEETPA